MALPINNEAIKKTVTVDEAGKALFLEHYKSNGKNGHRHEKKSDFVKPTYEISGYFNTELNPIGKNLSSNSSIGARVLAKDVILDTVEITSTNKKLNFNTPETNDLKINESAETHIVLTPAIDDKDKNKIIDSGQVIGKLETTITNFDPKSIGTSEVKSVDTTEFKSVGTSKLKLVGASEIKSIGSSEPKSVGSSQPKSIDNAEFTSFGNLTLPTIKTHLAEVKLPQSSLYRINPDHPKGYLVETDPKFTQREKWLSSDYLLNQLRYDHNRVQKRLGDGFYEQRLVNEQVNQLTGRRFIEGYTSDLEQYKALMNSGAKYAKKFNLAVGIGLTA